MTIAVEPECAVRYMRGAESLTDEKGAADERYSTKIPVSADEFLTYVSAQKAELIDGYAPFCKHLFVPSPYHLLPTSVPLAGLPPTAVETAYLARRDSELPVLCRYVRADVAARDLKVAPARYIDCILYSRQQMVAEYAAMGMDDSVLPVDCDWLIISLKFQMEPRETPMQPITMFRNTMIAEGGSGVPLDRDAYMQSVEYWRDHVELL